MVFNWGQYGHVAVVTQVSGSKIQVIEQNSSPTGTNGYTSSVSNSPEVARGINMASALLTPTSDRDILCSKHRAF